MANTKVQVLESYEKQLVSSQIKLVSHSKPPEDVMNAYLKAEGRDLKGSTQNPGPSIEYACVM